MSGIAGDFGWTGQESRIPTPRTGPCNSYPKVHYVSRTTSSIFLFPTLLRSNFRPFSYTVIFHRVPLSTLISSMYAVDCTSWQRTWASWQTPVPAFGGRVTCTMHRVLRRRNANHRPEGAAGHLLPTYWVRFVLLHRVLYLK